MLKNISNLGNALTKNEQKEISGGRRLEQSISAGEGGYQCCNAWGCGRCVTGSNRDCSSYGEGVYGRAC